MARRRNQRDTFGGDSPSPGNEARLRPSQQRGETKRRKSRQSTNAESEAAHRRKLSTLKGSSSQFDAAHLQSKQSTGPDDTSHGPENHSIRANNSTQRQTKSASDVQGAAAALPWWRRPFALTLAGGLLMFLALPPFAWWPLAFAAPIPWMAVALQPELPGTRPWLKIWAAAWISWLLLLYYIRVPHWLLNFGWLVMAAYLCCYVPLFMAVTRQAVLRWGISPLVAAPLAWVGTEYLRSTLFGGFAMSLLGHALVRFPLAIQLADVAGGYWVSAWIVLVAASIYLIGRAIIRRKMTLDSSRPSESQSSLTREIGIPAGVALVAIAVSLSYGFYRLGEPTVDAQAE